MPSYTNALNVGEKMIARGEGDRQSLMRREAEAWLVDQCRQTLADKRPMRVDAASVEAYERSCDPLRQLWSRTIGEFSFTADFKPEWEPFFEDDKTVARWVFIDLAPGLRARAAFAVPKNASGRLPLVIAQHGIASTPERVFGLADPDNIYHGYGRALTEAGFAVLAPSNITEAKSRARLQRLCLLLGRTLAGLEVGKIRRLLDFAVTLPQVDPDRIGMWGISLGGFYTISTVPLEKRIKAGIVCAWFNDRFNKMAVSSPLYSSFLDADEEHIWVPGWFANGFGDAELLGMVCPRAIQIQQGRADGIGWWPLQHEEFDRAKAYYDKLGLGERIEYADHHGGHEILVDEGIAFMNKWLKV